MTHYELRDHPDDLPIICTDLATALRKGRRRSALVGPVLVYEMDDRSGERLISVID